ncbi:hypothetical protein HN51_027286 [Arachis hypogaea]
MAYNPCSTTFGGGDMSELPSTQLLELVEAGNGRRQRGDPIVVDVKFDEREEEANGVRERAEEVEVLANVKGFEADEVFEVVGEGVEAVETGVEDLERGEV